MSSIKQLLVLVTLLFFGLYSGLAQVDILVPESNGRSRQAEPITLGVPFSQGSLNSIEHLGIQHPSGEDIDAQFSIMSKWRDGSIRWAKCDFQASVAANAQAKYRLITNSSHSTATDLSVEENGSEITVITGPLRFSISKTKYNLINQAFLDVNGNGNFEAAEEIISKTNSEGWVATQNGQDFLSSQTPPSRIIIEEQGPMKVVLKVEGRHYDTQGNYFLKYETRIYAFAGKPYIKVRHSYANGTSVGSLGDSGSADFGVSVEEYRLGMDLNLSGDLSYQVGTNGQAINGTFNTGFVSLLQKDRPTVATPFQFELMEQSNLLSTGTKADGWATLSDNQWGLTVSSRFFWEKYPKGLRLFADGSIELQPVPTEEFLWAAMGSGDEFLFYFHPSATASSAQDWSHTLSKSPLIAHVAPEHLVETEAFYTLGSCNSNRWSNLNSFINTTTNNHLNNRDALDLYGNLHFGDVPRNQWELGENRDLSTWGNNYYDAMLTNARLFAQTGDRRFFDVMLPMAWNNMETQCFQTYDENDWMNGYNPSYSLNHRSTGHYNQHYGEGIWYYYYLTGDERAREIGLRAARSIRDYHLWGLNNPNARLAYQNASACLEAWKATGETSYLETFKTYVIDRILATQNSYGMIGGYSAEGGLDFPGEQTFMMALFSDSVWKYLKEFPEDETTKDQLLLLADFVNQYARVNPNEETYYNFWYSPTEPGLPQFWLGGTSDDYVYWTGKSLISGLYAYAYDVSGEQKYKTMAENTMDFLYNQGFGNQEGNFSWGKASSEAMKNVIHSAAILCPGQTTPTKDINTTSKTLIVFPNPSRETLQLSPLTGLADQNYRIVNMSGQVIQKGQVPSSRSLDITQLPTGIYAIQVGQMTTKFSKTQ